MSDGLDDDDAIQRLQVRKWETLSSVNKESFKSLLGDPEAARKFDEAYITSVAERWRELTKFSHRLFFVILPSVLIIAALNSDFIKDEIVFLGLKITRSNGAIEVLLLLASLLVVVRSVTMLMEDHYGSIVRSYVEINSDPQSQDYCLLKFGWTVDAYFHGMANQKKHLTAPFVVLFPVFGMALSLIVIGAIATALEFFILLDAAISVFRDPIFPPIVSVPIAIVAFFALVCRASLLLLALPLPYSDSSNLYKLKDLEESDPARAERVKRHLADTSSRNERRNMQILQMVAMLGTMVLSYLVAVGTGFYAELPILIDFALASGSFLLVVSPLFGRLEKKATYAAIEVEDSDLRLSRYIRVKKWALWLRLIFSALFGAVSFLWLHLEPLANL